MNKSKLPLSWLSRLIINKTHPKTLLKPSLITPPIPFRCTQTRRFCSNTEEVNQLNRLANNELQKMLAEVEREKNREREAKKKAGINVDAEEEVEEDFMGVGPLIEKLNKQVARDKEKNIRFNIDMEEDSESESEDDDDDEERAAMMRKKEEQLMQRKIKRHKELMKEFEKADTLDDCFKWMNKLDKFEEKHFNLRPEYRVIGELINRFKEATGKDKFLLAQKLNRAMKLVEHREAFDPNSPANYSIIQQEEVGTSAEVDADVDLKREEGDNEAEAEGEEEEEEFDDMKERDDILLQKLTAIDKKLEEKLAALDHTFGKKGKLLEEEIRDLAEERNSLTEKKRIPMYRKGFDVHLIDMNRTCKVTKGGQVVKYTAILACGNYNGVVGYAKARGPAVPIALQKAYEKCFQNLHYIDRYEDHTIAHAVQTTYKKTKVYLWPAKMATGMKAGRTVQTILNLAGFKNIKSKVIGSRNPHNTVKAVFQALNAVETPKDVQEKFGRTVVESYLL